MLNLEQTKFIVGPEIEVSGWYLGDDGRMHHTHYCTECALEAHVTKSSEWGQTSVAEMEIKNGLQFLIDRGCTHVTTETDNKKQHVDPNIWSQGADSKGAGRGRVHSKPTAGKRK